MLFLDMSLSKKLFIINQKDPHNIMNELAINIYFFAVLFIFIFLGGAEGTRTPHLIHAMDALYQMSYSPGLISNGSLFYLMGLFNVL